MPRPDRSPDPLPADPDAALAALTDRERTFARAILRGESPSDAAVRAEWHPDNGWIALGRPSVRSALLTLAPLLASNGPSGEALARRILRPYALARTAACLALGGQTGLAAARDLADAPTGGDGGELRRAWEGRAGARDGALAAVGRVGGGG